MFLTWNFDIIWYSVLFAAKVYSQYLSDHLICWTSFLWMLSFLFTWNDCLVIVNLCMMIIRKINFDIIWYSLIVTLTLPIISINTLVKNLLCGNDLVKNMFRYVRKLITRFFSQVIFTNKENNIKASKASRFGGAAFFSLVFYQ